jgi:hypothetical protein
MLPTSHQRLAQENEAVLPFDDSIHYCPAHIGADDGQAMGRSFYGDHAVRL